MPHPQSSPRGLFYKTRIRAQTTLEIGANNTLTANSTAVLFSAGARLSGQANAMLTGNSTGLVVAGGVRVSNARYITADSTGYVLTAESALPGNVDGGIQFTAVSNSTGVALAVNTTGTTWKYLNVTTAQPT